jgi:hypothetical protein
MILMTRLNLSFLVPVAMIGLSFMAVFPAGLSAQCPGNNPYTISVTAFSSYRAVMVAAPATTAQIQFFMGATGADPCGGGQPFGTGVTNCSSYYGTGIAFFIADFASSAANNTLNGCSFGCPAGPSPTTTCIVRGGDALPVELMGFSIGPDEDSVEADEPAPDGEAGGEAGT